MSRVAPLITVVLAGALGLAMFLVPDRVAAALQLPGMDPFAYRSGGAAFFGYAAALLIGWNASPNALRIMWLETLAGALATVVAALIAMVSGHSAGIVPLILTGAVLVGVASLYSLDRSRWLPAATGRQFRTWFVAFLGWGVIAAALFGLGGLILGSTFGSIAGFPGTDDTAYRLAGAATVGIMVASAVSIRTQDWELVRLPVLLGFVTNVFSLIGGLIVIYGGGAPIVLWLIVGAAIFNVVGLGLALAGRR